MPPPNVLLISIDTLRADRVGAYSGRADVTPSIDRLARAGRTFDNATTPLPMTRPAHFSMLTGLAPREHGVLDNQTPLPDDVATLPEAFHAAGYRTGAFLAVSLLGRDSGIAKGFETFAAPSETHGWTSDLVVPRLRAWLETAPRDQPFFAWLHLFDPHMPYAPPEAYRHHDPSDDPSLAQGFSWPLALSLSAKGEGALPGSILRQALALYEGEVRYTDHWVGEATRALADLHLRERTVVVLTADHGECFEHGIFFEHSDCLYDGAVHVPLLIYDPRDPHAGERVAVPTGHADLAPRLIRLTGISVSGRLAAQAAGWVPGDATTQAPAAFIQGPVYPPEAQSRRRERGARIRSVGGESTRPLDVEHPQFAIRDGRWKLIRRGTGKSPSTTTELYDLRADPGENTNLAGQRSDLVEGMGRMLDAWLASRPARATPPSVANPALLETLRSLGYDQ